MNSVIFSASGLWAAHVHATAMRYYFSMRISVHCMELTANIYLHMYKYTDNARCCMLQMGAGIRCQICYMTFADQSTINAHYEAMHDKSARGAHACDVCDRRFSSKQYLRHHKTTAHGVGEARKFKCDVCSQEFSQKSNLRTHMKRKHQH